MKFWLKALEKLKKSEKTLRSVYEQMCIFSSEVFFEQLSGNTIQEITYGEFNQNVIKTAASLNFHINAPRSSYIGLEMENCPEWVVSFWALLMKGFRPVLLNTRMLKEQLDEIIKTCNIRAVITKTPSREIDIDFNSLVETETAYENFKADWEDVFALTTSGTTKSPRIFLYNGAAVTGQILSSEYILSQNSTIKYNSKGEVKLLAFLPFYHIFGLIANLMWFSFFGRRFVFLKDYNPETIRYVCRRHKITHFFAVPDVWNNLASFIKREAALKGAAKKLEKALNFSINLQNAFPNFGRKFVSKFIFKDIREKIFGNSVMFCINGGGYLRDDALKIINGLGYPLYNGYGMTEIGITSVELSKKVKKRLRGSVGKPFLGTEYSIDKYGVLNISKGPMHFAELKDGKINIRDLTKPFNTNDYFIKIKDRYYIQGRHDEIIIADNGEKIPPDTIEKRFDLIYAKSYCVFGIRENDQTKIILIINPKKEISSVQLDEMLLSVYETDKKLKPFEKLTKVLLTADELPLALGTKLRRNVIRDMYIKNQFITAGVDLTRYGDIKTIKDENYHSTLLKVKEVFMRILNLPLEMVTEKGNFMLDFGGGSLEYFSLLEELSKAFNVHFDFTENFLATPAEFTDYILKK